MMIFTLEVLPARKGDCLLLHFGTEAEPGLVLIDGGPSGVYSRHLKPRLLQIREGRKLGKNKPLNVDLLLVSHIDDDHIHGLLEMTGELTAQRETGVPPFRILDLWHNSLESFWGKDSTKRANNLAQAWGATSLANADSGSPGPISREAFLVLASVPQGQQLRYDALVLKAHVNRLFAGKPVLAARKALAVAKDLTFTVAGPLKTELEDLKELYDKWEAEQKKSERVQSALAAYIDESVTNLSSIVALAKFNGKKILLTGDARGDKILEGLESIGLLQKGGKLHVDVLKIPHHGSSNNLEQDFFERVTADHYVFSGNGEHGNPERETMEMLFAARTSNPFQVHLTYPIKDIDAARKVEWEKQQAKERKKNKSGKSVRKNWSAEKNGLEKFFAKLKLASGQKIRIVDPKIPHLIQLLDKLEY
jgi:hypothetical protein